MSSLVPHIFTNYSLALESLLKMTENFSSHVYMDGNGVPTVGYGFALAVLSHNTWTQSADIGLLPTSLSSIQISELNTAIANLNTYGLSPVAKTKNNSISANLQAYSITEPEASKLLDIKTNAAEAEVKRILGNNGVSAAELLALNGTKELAALVDINFNGLIFTKAAQAYASGNRAKFWYEIRYGIKSATGNGVNDRGLQKRRYWDAEWVGLYDGPTATIEEAKNAYIQLNINRTRIFQSESIHGISPDGTRGSWVVNGKTAFELAQDPNSAGPQNSALPQTLTDSLMLAYRAFINDIDNKHLMTSPIDQNVFSNSASIFYLGDDTQSKNLDARSLDARSGNNLNNNILVGGSGDDFLYGGAGSDILIGGDGKDLLDGGTGSDILIGGIGDDTYIWNAGDHDRIIDSDGIGKIQFKAANGVITEISLAGAFAKSTQSGNHWLYTLPDGTVADLSHNSPWKITMPDGSILELGENFSDGNFGIHLVEETTISNTPSLTISGDFASKDMNLSMAGVQTGTDALGNIITDAAQAEQNRQDTLYGSVNNDVIKSYGGDDNIDGKAGNDQLDGGDGSDIILGNSGDDVIVGGTGSDLLLGQAGSDKLYASAQIDLSLALTQNANQIASGAQGEYLSGGDDADTLIGDSGNDILIGGSGGDILAGGGGNDIILSDVDSTVVNRGWTASQYVTTANGITTYGYNTTGMDIQNAAQSGDDVLYGQSGNDYMFAGAGNDFLDGGADNDVLFGDAGNDSLQGGTGDDVLNGDAGLNGAATDGSDFVDGGDGNDDIRGDGGGDTLFGGAGADKILGDSQADGTYGGNDYIDGGSGNDTIWGSAGADTILGGAGNDYIEGDYSTLAAQYHGNDTIDGGDGDDTIYGEGGDDNILGGIGLDTIYGGDGNDTLDGGEGDDTLSGENGDDTLISNAGADLLQGGAGNDTYVISSTSEAHIIDTQGNNTIRLDNAYIDSSKLSFDSYQVTTYTPIGGGLSIPVTSVAYSLVVDMGNGGGRVRIDGFDPTKELSTTSAFGFVFADGAVMNNAQLLAIGFDLNGGNGNVDDTITGTSFGDRINGLLGNDTLSGLAGDDVLSGGDGFDILEGGKGNDTLDGGNGGDTYKFSLGDGQDTIIDGGTDDTVISFSTGIATSSVSISQITGTDGLSYLKVSYGTSGDSFTILNNGDTSIGTFKFAGAATDYYLNNLILQPFTLIGTSAGETLTGGAKNETLNGKAGNDTLSGGLGNDTYVFNIGDGTDTIVETTSTTFGAATNWVQFGTGVNYDLSNISASQFISNGQNYLSVQYGANANDKILIQDGFLGAVRTFSFGSNSVTDARDYTDIISSINSSVVLQGTAGDDYLLSGKGADTLSGGAGADTIVGGAGVDSLNGGAGEDTYRFKLGDGADTLTEANDKISHLMFGAGITQSNISITYTDPLHPDPSFGFTLRYSANDSIKFNQGLRDGITADFTFDNGSTKVNSIEDLLTSVNHTAQSLTGDASNNILVGSDQNDTLSGLAGNDILLAGAGNDKLDGGLGSDTLNGGTGLDTYLLSRGGGSDLVIETGAETNRILLDSSLALTDIVATLNQSDLVVTIKGSTDSLTIYNYSVNNSPWQISLANGTVVSTVADLLNSNLTYDQRIATVKNDFLNVIKQTDGAKFSSVSTQTQSSDTANIFGTAQNNATNMVVEEIIGGASNNHIYQANGQYALSVNGVRLKQSSVLDIAHQLINGGNGADVIDGGGWALDGNSIDIWFSSQINLRVNPEFQTYKGNFINGGGGDDVLIGTALADELIGGSGNDYLNGAGGGDTYRVFAGTDQGWDIIDDKGYAKTFANGTVTDSNYGYGGVTPTDTVVFESGILRQNLQFSWGRLNNQSTLDINWGQGTGIRVVVQGDLASNYFGTAMNVNTSLPAYFNKFGIENFQFVSDGTSMTLAQMVALAPPKPVVTVNFAVGGGHLTSSFTNVDVIQFTGSITRSNVTLSNEGYDLLINHTNGVDQLRIIDWFKNQTPAPGMYQESLATPPLQFKFSSNGDTQYLGGLNGYDINPSGANNIFSIDKINNNLYTSLSGTDTDVVQSSISFTLPDTFKNLTLTGTASIDGTGSYANNILTGNSGNNILNGGTGGNDTYVLSTGFGNDLIIDTDSTAANIDTIYFAAGINPGDVKVSRNGNNLLLTVGTNVATVQNWFLSADNKIEQVKFANSTTTWNVTQLTQMAGNVAPAVTNLSTAETYTEDVALNLNDIVITDADSATHTVILTLSNIAAGALNTATSGAVTSTYNATTGVWTATGATASVNALLAGVTFTPSANYNGNFTIATSVSDGFATITGSKTFTGVAVNDAPTAANATITITINEDTAKVFALADFGFSDVDVGNTLQSVTITSLPTAGGLLLNGTAVTLNQVIAASSIIAGQLVFSPIANANGMNYANFNFKVSDGTVLSASAYTMTFNVNAVNDAPTATNLSTAQTYTQNIALNLNDIVITDIDSSSVNATLTLSNVAAGVLNTATSGTVTSTYNATTGVWTASGTTANVNALLAGLTFTPAINFTGSFTISTSVTDGFASAVTGSKSFTGLATNVAPTATNLSTAETYTEDVALNLNDIVITDVDSATHTATLTLSNVAAGTLNTATSGSVTSTYNATTGVWTASGATASVNALLAGLTLSPAANYNGSFTIATSISDGTAPAITGTKTFTGVAVNDAPTAANQTVTTNEDTAKVFALADFGFTDVDAGNTLQSVTITSLPLAGSLKLNGVAVTANQVITAANITSGLLSFTPAQDANGTNYANFGFKVSDGAALSASAYTMTLNVNAVNDAPTATNLSAAEIYTQNTALNLNDIVITDVDSATHTVTLTLSNVAAGTLNTATSGSVTSAYNATTGVWTATGATASVNTLLAGLTFTPATNFTGNFTIGTSVTDGVAAAVTGSKSFTRLTTNIAPTATNLSTAETYTEDVALNLNDIVITDVDSATHTATLTLSNVAAGNLNTATSGTVTSTYNATTGVWTASGATASVNALLAGLTFSPSSNYNGSFTIATSISDGVAPAITGTKTFTGIAVNDAPTAANATVTTNEDTAKVFALADFGFSDVDAGNTLQSVTITSLPAVGSLKLNGVAVTANQVITAPNITSGLLTFAPVANANGANYANFGFKVSDGTALSASAYTMTLNVSAVNDAPTATNLSTAETYTEDVALNLNDIVITDVDSATHTATLTLSNVAAGSLNTATSGSVNSTYNATSGVWTATGATASVNALLAGLTLTPAANYNGSFTIATSVSDGVAPAITGTKTFTGVAVNDAPTATNLSTSETYTQNTALNLNDIVISDVDSATHTATLTLSNVAAGTLNTATSGTVTSTYNATTGVWTATGATASVNALLAGLTFTPATNFTGSFTISTSVTDGVAAAITGSKSFVSTVTTINGTANNDTLNGTTANDILYGLTGDDTISGGGGDDKLYGGSQVDTASGKVISTLVISAKASLMSDGVGASMQIYADGVLKTTVAVTNTAAFQDYTIAASVFGSIQVHNLDIVFSNDTFAFPQDRNLYLNSITLNGQVASPTVNSFIDLGTGSAAFDGVNIKPNSSYMNENAALRLSLDGNDLLDGGAGADIMAGGYGNDTYIVDNVADQVIEQAGGGYDTLQTSISFDLTSTPEVEYLVLTGTNAINGTGNGSNNILSGNAANNTLLGGAGIDELNGNAGNDILDGGSGDDRLFGGDGDDNLQDSSGINYLNGGNGNDSLLDSGAFGVMQGMAGDDRLEDAGYTAGQYGKLLDGGAGIDTLLSGDSNDIFIGGTGNDNITTGAGYDVIVFNKGDGQDIINASTGADNTISLGGNFAYSDLSLTKSANDLILKVGASDQITLSGWYTAAANKSVVNLQVIAEAIQGFSLGSADGLRNNKIENFDFAGLVASFDTAGATANWQLTDARLTAFLKAGSDTAALGGDLAYLYGKNTSLSYVAMTTAQNTLSTNTMGQSAQTINFQNEPLKNWSPEVLRLS